MRRRYYHRDTRTIEQPPAALHHVLMGRNLTPEQRYSFDCLGYLVIPDAIEPALLVQLQRLMVEREHCALSAAAADNPPSCLRHQRATDGRLIEASWMNVLDEDTAMLDLIANPGVLAYVQSMVDRPILEQFILYFPHLKVALINRKVLLECGKLDGSWKKCMRLKKRFCTNLASLE